MSGRERRVFERFLVNLSGRVCGRRQAEPMNVINLSKGGALILGGGEYANWEDLLLEVEFSAERTLRLPVSVCWAEAGLAGVKFVCLPAEVEAFLDLYLNEYATEDVCGSGVL